MPVLPDVSPGIGLTVAYQAVQIALASLTVAAYAALQLGLTGASDRRYLLMNLLGAGGLLVVAAHSFELGFIITNGLWVVVSLAGLVRRSSRNQLGRADSTAGGAGGIGKTPRPDP
jgi:hypothetical protein